MDTPSYLLAFSFFKGQFKRKCEEEAIIWYNLATFRNHPYMGMEFILHANRIIKYRQKYG
jgi:hypothetical protein